MEREPPLSPPSFVSYDFDSEEFRHYYRSKRATAFAYLCVVGSKALVICDANEAAILEAAALANASPSSNMHAPGGDNMYREDNNINTDTNKVGIHSNATNATESTLQTLQTSQTSTLSVLATPPASSPRSIQSPTDRFKKGLVDEAVIKVNMIKEEQIRQFRRRFAWKDGIQVYKRGRNGKTRSLNVRLVVENALAETFICDDGMQLKGNPDEDSLQWRGGTPPSSLFGGWKVFSLKDLVSVTVLTTSSSNGNRNRNQGTQQHAQHHVHSQDSKIAVIANENTGLPGGSAHGSNDHPTSSSSSSSSFDVPFIRFRNSKRYLDLRFHTQEETNACHLWVSMTYLKMN